MNTNAKQTITTKYHGPTNTKGSRVSATTSSGVRIYRRVDNAYTVDENHFMAAEELKKKLEWKGIMHAGGLKTGYVFVFQGGGIIL